MQIISKKFNSYSSNYESIILAEINDKCRNDFFESHLIRELNCYKNLENPSCIDLFLTNSPNSFQSVSVVETGLSDYYGMTVTAMETYIQSYRQD